VTDPEKAHDVIRVVKKLSDERLLTTGMKSAGQRLSLRSPDPLCHVHGVASSVTIAEGIHQVLIADMVQRPLRPRMVGLGLHGHISESSNSAEKAGRSNSHPAECLLLNEGRTLPVFVSRDLGATHVESSMPMAELFFTLLAIVPAPQARRKSRQRHSGGCP
jgi:hypothetical protein